MSLFSSLRSSVPPSHTISGTVDRLIISFGAHMLNDDISRCFFHFFFQFFCVSGVNRQKIAQNEKYNHYICHVPYLQNSVAYDHDFRYTCVKWWYLQLVFLFSFILNFPALTAKNSPKWKTTITSVMHHI